ncbi:hypothetical protein I4U23_020062 [Adineta vaga]|nr:hypothetical protein I4U23_020062 [Adineta vaga]
MSLYDESSLFIPDPHEILLNKKPSSTTIFIRDSTIPSVKTNHADHVDENFYEKRRSAKNVSMANVSRRLHRRKILFDRLCIISNHMCILGIVGVLLMIVENEITFKNLCDSDTFISWFLRLIISITTLMLVGFVFYYHHLDLQHYAVSNSYEDWRIGLTKTKVFLIFFEAFVCLIHPIPEYYPVLSNSNCTNSTIVPNPLPKSYITMNVALGLPMFARVYLICRSTMFHSHLIQHFSSQSLGALNRVSLDVLFLAKIYLTQWPIRCLLGFCTILFFIGSWSLRACNYNSSFEHLSLFDAMWLFIVTFTTVGYGDLVPMTYCGRSIAAITAFIGVLSTALLISVLAHRLELIRSEKYVYNFLLEIDLAKQRKIQAANVVKFVVKLWYLKRTRQSKTSSEYIQTERRLFRSMYFNQRLKQEQRNLVDSYVNFPELITIQRNVYTKTKKNKKTLKLMKSQVKKIKETLLHMDHSIKNIQNTLDLLLNKTSL